MLTIIAFDPDSRCDGTILLSLVNIDKAAILQSVEPRVRMVNFIVLLKINKLWKVKTHLNL